MGDVVRWVLFGVGAAVLVVGVIVQILDWRSRHNA